MTQPSISAFEAQVLRIEDISPNFRRITFGGEGLHPFGMPYHPRDQRIKLLIPPKVDGPLFDLPGFLAEQHQQGVSWYQAWLKVSPELRGVMRTYTVRQWLDEPRELVVDMVLHVDEDGRSGPAAHWAHHAQLGHRLHIMGPSRQGEPLMSGIDFVPEGASHILLVGDETAVPAIASILDYLKDKPTIVDAFLEVPVRADIQELPASLRTNITWLVREGAPHGEKICNAVRAAFDSSSRLRAAAVTSEISSDEARSFYAWLAGEAGIVKQLRRFLVWDKGIDRHHVTFSGYWRRGRAEGED